MIVLAWFIVISLLIIFGLPHVLDTITWYYGKRLKQVKEENRLLTEGIELLERQHEIIKAIEDITEVNRA